MSESWRSGSVESIASGAAGSRWRLDQERRRRLSNRGRMTVLVLGCLVAGALSFSALGPGGRAPDPPRPTPPQASAPAGGVRTAETAQPLGERRVPAVASGPQRELPDPIAGAGLLARLPATRSVLSLPTYVPESASDAFGSEPVSSARFYEQLDVAPGGGEAPVGPLRIEYTLDAELTRQVFEVLDEGKVAMGHVIVMEPTSGRVLAYASTDPSRFPATRTYPAASLVKVITAAAALARDPERANVPCRFTGSPYRLTPSRLDPPRGRGTEISLAKALATSNNQCFAQIAVHHLGQEPLVDALTRFGWNQVPAPGHPSGVVPVAADRFALGEMGCGLDGCSITPLHAAQMAAVLARGQRVTPRWIERVVDSEGHVVATQPQPEPVQVIRPELARELREMLVDTTLRGTARSAFRRHARHLVGVVQVAGKTGSLSGTDPVGHYEWFVGVAPAENPRIAIATVVVNGARWWRSASQLAAEVLERTFCDGRRCGDEQLARWLPPPNAGEPPAALAPPLGDAG